MKEHISEDISPHQDMILAQVKWDIKTIYWDQNTIHQDISTICSDITTISSKSIIKILLTLEFQT